jgi:diapolycopene oxygenase
LGELNIKCYFNAEVKEILINEKKACGVKVSVDGKISDFHSDFVVSNMEIIPAHEKLLNTSSDFLKKFEPACSGIVIHLGTNKIFPQLAHHNFFYAQDQAHHFDRVFKEGRLPNDPTLYVVAPTRSDPSQAPPNCDNIKILPHIPHLGSKVPYTYEDCQMLKEIVLIKMERMGLKDLRKHIVVEDFWTPFDIEKKYYSNKGSIYGVVSDTWKNLALKAPKKSKKFKNLFFVGGSVNPGGGMPMVVLSGQHVARMISKECQC